MTKQTEYSLSVSTRDCWLCNPLTWLVLLSYAAMAYVMTVTFLSILLLQVGHIIIAVAVNLELEYESVRTEYNRNN
jgi:hypothetical protein